MQLRTYNLTMFALSLLLNSSVVSANNMYKWIDETGRTVFSDQITPEKAGVGRELLNKGGRVIEVIEKSKTREQVDLERRLGQLRKEQEKIISNQRLRDSALLNTFHSKEEMDIAFTTKIQNLDSQKRVFETQLTRLNEQLAQQQATAAALERDAQTVTEKLLKDMAISKQQIQQTNEVIANVNDKKRQANDEYQADLDRFLFLMQRNNHSSPPTNRIASIKEASQLGLFFCENDKECSKVWEIARGFINLHSTTSPDIYNDKLIMNRPPATDSDLSLSLSKIAIDDDNYELFLDIRCRESSGGRELCNSTKVQAIRAEFLPYINQALARAATQ